MSLAQVKLPAPTPRGLDEWSFAHLAHHNAIRQAMERAHGIALPQRQIWPIDFENPASVQVFLSQHQEMHSDFESILGIQGNDLANVDFNDEKARDSWFYLNWQSHYSAGASLGQAI